MGALPSRESNEDPSTVFFANCGSHVVFHIPMTPHFFPSHEGLAFQQLLHARNNQSALYCFDVKDVAPVLPQQAAEAFREAQDEDWGPEAEEPDPSVHYYDAEVQEKVRECGGAVDDAEPTVGRHFKHAVEDADKLYKVLIEEPTAGTLVDTDAEMCALFDAEQRWRDAVAEAFSKPAKPGGENSSSSSGSNNTDSSNVAGPSPSPLPPLPEKFLYPLPHAIALRMTTEEEEEMRAEYCRVHNIPYVAPHFHDVKPGQTPPIADAAAVERLGVPRTSSSTCYVACPLPMPLPLVERRRYHFEDDPKYRDGRVHLVEEHGVLYHFAYFPKKRRPTTAAAAAAANAVKSGGPPTTTPIVLDRCLHDVVYSEEPDTSVSNNKQLAAAAAAACASSLGVSSTCSGEPEMAPAKRYGRCARCGARIEQRMDYTQLRRLKATRVQRREARRAEAEAALAAAAATAGNAGASNTAESAEAAAQRKAWADFAAARDAERRRAGGGGGNDGDSDDAPGSDNDLEVASHTERVEEEGEAEFIINIAPVRIGGMDGLLPSRTRGTPWLRGYEHEDDAAADRYIEQQERRPPVMRTCRFVEGSVGDKIVNRAALVTMLSYRPMCRQAGLSSALTRPVWSTCVLSNIPYLQMVRETFFRAKAAVAEVDDKDLLLRNWLDVVDRENNFYNFINANLYMMRNFTPPERTVRQHEPPEDTASTTTTFGAASSSAAGGFGNGSVGTGHGNSAASSPMLCSPTGKAGGGGGFDLGSSQQQAGRNAATSTSPTKEGESHHKGKGAAAAAAATTTCSHFSLEDALLASGEGVCPPPPASATTAPAVAAAPQQPGQPPTTQSSEAPTTAPLAKGTKAAAAGELRGQHLTRDLEEATIGRPEGQGPRDAVENGDSDDSDDDTEDSAEVRSRTGNDAAARAARRKEEKRKAKAGKKSKSKKAAAAAESESGLTSTLAATVAATAAASTSSAAYSNTVSAAGTATMHPSSTRDVAGGDDNDGGEASGRPLLIAVRPASPRHRHRASAGQSPLSLRTGEGFDDDEDADLYMEEEGQQRKSPTAGHHAAHATTAVARRASTTATEETDEQQQQQRATSQRVEVPPRPNFQLFSSRLEPHAPVSLYSLFDYDINADVGVTGGSESGAAAGQRGGDASAKEQTDAAITSSTAAADVACADRGHGAAALPSYVQHDVLRENERRQAEPKALRRPSHALYECGMLATTRGRNLLFLLREDCVHALLYYLSSAAAPIFIGAYIEPVDTTSVSYGGAVRLQRPDSVPLALDDADADVLDAMEGGERRQSNGAGSSWASAAAATPLSDGGAEGHTAALRRVVIGPVEGMEVMAEYYKSKGLITCFSVSDVDHMAPGPSAAHRLRKMILPSPHTTTGGSGSDKSDAERALALRQNREASQLGHTFTYAAHEFRDGDLVVYNFDERRWEHYEHVQLRRRFSAKAAAVAAAAAGSPYRGNNSSCPMGRSSAASSSLNSTTALGLLSSVVGGGVGGRGNDDVAAMVDGSLGGASSVADASMSARLLCVGLDELLLSWTKWVVDNRFYEDRSDLGWLNLPDGSPIQLGGRYFLWSFRHNNQRYFYGVIPKFAKGRLRRQKLMERNRRKKKEADTSRSGPGSTSPSSGRGAKREAKAGGKGRTASATATATAAAPAGKSHSPFATGHPGRPHSTGSTGSQKGRRRGGSGGGGGGHGGASYTDPAKINSGRSTLHAHGMARAPHAGATAAGDRLYSVQQQQRQHSAHGQPSLPAHLRDPHDFSEPPSASQQQQQQPGSALHPHSGRYAYADNDADGRRGDSANVVPVSPSHHGRSDSLTSPVVGTGSFGAQCRSSPLLVSGSFSGYTGGGGGSGRRSAPSPHAGGASHWQQGAPAATAHATTAYGTSPGQAPPTTTTASPLGVMGSHSGGNFPSVRVGNNLVRPALSSSLNTSGPNAAVRRAPLLGPPPAQPRGAPAPSPGQAATSGGGGQNYYHQYGGNTFIQDGKRHENEYYPPLPQSTPFHPTSQAAASKLVPLPHPPTERGGIPAMFRYFGPAGHPSSRSNTTLPRTSGPLPPSSSQQQQQPPLSSSAGRQLFPASASPNSSLSQTPATMSVSQSVPACPAVAAAAASAAPVTMTVGGNPIPAAPLSNLTVRVRRRGLAAPATSGAAAACAPLCTIVTAGGSLIPSGPPSLSASVNTATFGGPSPGPAAIGNTFSASFPATPVLHVEPQAQQQVLPHSLSASLSGPPGVGAATSGGRVETPPRRLSPTSMLPAHLVNEGSKTKGESVLRVDEDMYVQRQAFRWNPYASNKWAAGEGGTE